MNEKLIVGLTGGIGSGKSTVSTIFASLGVEIIDADHIAHGLVKNNSPLCQQIIEHFGDDLQNTEGELNRAKLRDLIFSNPSERHWLEQLLHPPIIQDIQHRISQVKSSYGIVMAPLLIEILDRLPLQRVLVVDADEALQIERVRTRDQLSEIQIKSIMQSQLSREKRLAAATDIILNNAGIKELHQQVATLHAYYLEMAKK